MDKNPKGRIFRDRIDAGCQLAAHPELQKIKSLPSNEKDSYLVISLPRGGTVVGDELAKRLEITHDLVFPRKIPCRGQSEFAMADRLSQITDWLYENNKHIEKLPIGYFGASTGGAAAIIADGVKQQKRTKAIVSRGGRPDLVPDDQLNQLTVPTLLIVGSADTNVIKMNEEAFSKMIQLKDDEQHKSLKLVPNATHLFEEKGALEQVSKLATQWFKDNFQKD